MNQFEEMRRDRIFSADDKELKTLTIASELKPNEE